jgi:hypothetical protein
MQLREAALHGLGIWAWVLITPGKRWYNKTRDSVGWTCVAHLSFCFEETYYRTFHRCFPSSFGSLGQAVSEKKIFRNQPTRNKNCLWQPCLLTDRDNISNLYRGPSIDASYQVSVQLAKQFQGRRFLEIDQSETRIVCGSHVC